MEQKAKGEAGALIKIKSLRIIPRDLAPGFPTRFLSLPVSLRELRERDQSIVIAKILLSNSETVGFEFTIYNKLLDDCEFELDQYLVGLAHDWYEKEIMAQA